MAAIATSLTKSHCDSSNSNSNNDCKYPALVYVDGKINTYRLISFHQSLPLQYSVVHKTFDAARDHDKFIVLLHEYGQGADGRVWLASYSDGTLAVVKFPCPKRSPNENLTSIAEGKHELMMDEVQCWNEIYPDHPARSINISIDTSDISPLASFIRISSVQHAFIFPFVFCAEHVPQPSDSVEKQLRFETMTELSKKIVSFNSSSFSAIVDDAVFLTVECEEVDKIIQAANAKPMQVAEEAVDHCLQAGWEHLDVQWRHIGILVARKSIHSFAGDRANSPSFAGKPVLIDLGRMKKLVREVGSTDSASCPTSQDATLPRSQCTTQKDSARRRMLKTLVCTFKDGLCHCEPD